ncbi:MAG: thiolase family protein [Deltaproteobacteria bacterium]|nr:thiolase family protein [Deltaproteobacteria bacterium]
MLKTVYVLAARRTPVGSFMGALANVPAPKLGAVAIEAALKEAGVKPEAVSQVYMGCVLSAGIGQAPARQAAIFAGLPKSTPCTTVNKVCGSGMKAVMLAAQSIETGESEVVVAGGMENMSLVPHLLENSRNGYRMGHQKMTDGMIKDGLWDPYNDFHMGNAAELCAKELKFSREAQDQFAIQSFKRAQDAIKNGHFKKEIAPVAIQQKKGDPVLVDTDEGPGKAQFDKIPKLSPVFIKDGTVTAANASTINDGASALVLASEEYVKRAGAKPIAKLVSYSQFAQAPEWFTTAPVEAARKVLKSSSWEVKDVDLWEVNEAFAVVAMASRQELGIDEAKLNVHGGGVSLGHPIGSSGARILVTLIHALGTHGKRKGLASICIGGGEATAVTLERV